MIVAAVERRLDDRMVMPGNWHVELDDGTSDRHCEIDGAVLLGVGDILPGTLYGRRWIIERVDVDSRTALGKPHGAVD